MDRDFIEYVSQKINAEIANMREDTIKGMCKDYGDYKWACGIVRGLMMANGILSDTVQEAEKDDG